jgi:hypothetical protein
LFQHSKKQVVSSYGFHEMTQLIPVTGTSFSLINWEEDQPSLNE